MTITDQCVCKICDCGKHKCPHKVKKVDQWGREVCSEYDRQFQPHDNCKIHSFKPPANPVCNDAPLSNLTTNRVDYIEHEVSPPEKHEHPCYEKPVEPMDTLSSYRNEYTEKPQCASRPIKPIQEARDNGKFESDTTNRTCYLPWNVNPPERHQPDKYVACQEPFSKVTSNRADYVPHDYQKMHSFKPPVTTLKSDQPFSALTEQRSNFISHNVEPHIPYAREGYVKPEAPFESRTTNRDNYTAHDTCRPISFKPPAHKVDSHEPFSGMTTNRSDYVAHDTKAPDKWEHEKYVKPEGDMDFVSTYRQQYISQPPTHTLPIKPQQSARNNEPFDGQTSYRQNYQNWDQPAEIVYHKEKYQPPTAPFTDQTTNRTTYVAHDCDRTPSCKPPQHSIEQLPFDGKTQYRCEFIDKPFHICPAVNLTTDPRSVSPEGYVYTGEDEEGHLYYSKAYGIPIELLSKTNLAA